MKKRIVPVMAATAAALLLTGCLSIQLGGARSEPRAPTVGQQLADLQKAKDAGAISDAEYQAQKARLLANE